jgi:hypothetical protein
MIGYGFQTGRVIGVKDATKFEYNIEYIGRLKNQEIEVIATVLDPVKCDDWQVWNEVDGELSDGSS